MAGHLLHAGNRVTVWNRTRSKADGLEAAGAAVAESPAHVASQSDIVFLCLGGDQDVLEVISEIGPGLRPDGVIVDHSTTTPTAALKAAELAPRFLDCPMTGGSMGAVAGTLTLFCGGKDKDFADVEPVMRAYAKRIAHVGPVGSGQRTKLANQIAVGGALIGLCEALAFAETAGLDLETTRELLNTGAAGSWAFTHYGPKIVRRDWTPGFSINHQNKDLDYCLREAETLGIELPGTEVLHRLLSKMQAGGRGAETTAALFEELLQEGDA